jgi:hypothetical protein
MRLLAALLLLAAAASAQAEDEARLRKAKFGSKNIRFAYRMPAGRAPAEKPGVRKGRVDRIHVYFVDMDGDGKFNERGVDAWGLTGLNYVLPLEQTAIIELTRYTWEVEEDGSFVHFTGEKVALDPKQEKVFRQFNYWRLMNGMPPVDFDPKLAAACAAHCTWMEKNGFKHVAEDGDDPIPPEAGEAGRRSCLSQEQPGMSVLMFYATFYHRLPLFDPATRAIGIGNSAKYTAIDGITRTEPRSWQYPIIVPAPNTDLQPTLFPPESPRPYPDDVKKPGFPITLTFDHTQVTDVKAQLWMAFRGRAHEIPLLVSSPTAPANPKRADNRKTICLIPKVPLFGKKTFRVKVSYKERGEPREHDWLFKTGMPRPVWFR